MMISFLEILPIVGLIVGLYFLARPPRWWQKIQKLKFENKFGRVARSDEHLNNVVHVGRRIEIATGVKSGPSKFAILESKEVNAFADESGAIFVTQGLLKLVGDDKNSIAAILAHEIAHIWAGHHEIQKHDKMKFMLLGHLFSVGGWITRLVGSFMVKAGAARYSQDQELEADRLAVSYLSLAGYDPYAMSRVLARLNEVFKSEGHTSNPLTELLSSHPEAVERIAASKAEAGNLSR